MFKQLVVGLCLLVVGLCYRRLSRWIPPQRLLLPTNRSIRNDGLGSYNFAFEQSDGTKKEEQGELRNAGSDDAFVAIKASYSWQGADGVVYTITYIADDNGYKPNIEQGPGGAVPPGVVASLLG